MFFDIIDLVFNVLSDCGGSNSIVFNSCMLHRICPIFVCQKKNKSVLSPFVLGPKRVLTFTMLSDIIICEFLLH